MGTWPSCVFALQAKDKDHWVRLFSQFCSKTANEEEEIVHKLLGDKFKVGFFPMASFPYASSSLWCLWLPLGD